MGSRLTGKVVLTGGGGFIGTHLAERLVATNSEVVLLDNWRRDSLSKVPALREHPRVKVATADVLDPAAVGQALEGAEIVVHLAAIAGVSSYYKEPLRTLRVNILGTANVLEQAAARGVRQFVQFSTSEVFGPDALWADEESGFQIGPTSDKRWVYATSKLAGEHFALRTAEEHGFAATVVRPFNVYGPRQTGEGAISNFCTACVEKKPIKVYGDGSALRAWCYVSDMVDAVLAVLERRDAAAGQTFNVGNPREVETTLGLARHFQRLVPGTRLEHEKVERAEVRARVPSIDRARRLLGFEPKVDLDEGLRRTLAWYEQERTKP